MKRQSLNIFRLLTLTGFFLGSLSLSAQENAAKKDEHKIQEVIGMDAPAAPSPVNADGTVTDTAAPAAKPMKSDEILKRAVNWVKLDNPKYVKSSGVNSGSKAECVVTFKYKPKELNPQADVEGTITMHVSIEAKEGKYRYTISKINHVAKNTEMSGGDIYNEVPQCGSMKLPPDLWKKIKSEGMKEANLVSADLKEAMKVPSDAPQGEKDEW
ncbi:MAG: hypothetical protein JST26_16300 [Bacteroidetes bacterium]|nr:hypothetical protein [Bacteroidota bacterium]